MVMAITVFAALATPSTDPLTMLLLAAPLSLLHFAACAVAWAHDHRRVRRTQVGTDESEATPLELPPEPLASPKHVSAGL